MRHSFPITEPPYECCCAGITVQDRLSRVRTQASRVKNSQKVREMVVSFHLSYHEIRRIEGEKGVTLVKRGPRRQCSLVRSSPQSSEPIMDFKTIAHPWLLVFLPQSLLAGILSLVTTKGFYTQALGLTGHGGDPKRHITQECRDFSSCRVGKLSHS